MRSAIRRRPRSYGLLSLLLAAACAPATASVAPVTPAQRDFARVADSIVSTPPLHRAHIGILVYEPSTRRVLYSHNAERHFVPASNEKLWPTTTALHELGPDFRYRTPILALGFDRQSGAASSLVVVGSGDPTFSARFIPQPAGATEGAPAPQISEEERYRRDLWVLERMADSVAAAGVRLVTGDLIVDASAFDEAIIPGTWTFGNLNGTSAPPTGAFIVTEGVFRITVAPGPAVGSPAIITPRAPAGVVPVANGVVTTGAELRARCRMRAGPGATRSATAGPWASVPLHRPPSCR